MVPVFVFLLLGGTLLAQSAGPTSLTGSQCLSVNILSPTTEVITVSGSWSGLLQAQSTNQNIAVTAIGISAAQNTITSNGIYTTRVYPNNVFQVCSQNISGTAVVTFTPPAQSSTTGTITGTQCVSLDVYVAGLSLLTVTGSWSGSIQPKLYLDPPRNSTVSFIGSSSAQQTIIGNGTYTTTLTAPNVIQMCGVGVSGTASLSITSAGSTSSGTGVAITTVAGLATVPGKVNGTIASVVDGISSTDCTVGGGSSTVACQYNGASWGSLIGSSLPAGVAVGSALVSNGVSQPTVYQTKEVADSADSAIVPDGSTDNCVFFQNWINAHPGQRLLVRKVAGATQGGGAVSTIDYYSSCTLHLTYNGTILEGVPNDDWQGAPVILFPPNVTGLQIDPSCSGCAIKNMEIAGGGKPYPNGLACYNSSNALAYPFTGSADGILVYGGEPTIEHTIAECFNRDAIHIDGTNVSLNGFTGQPDYWKVLYGQGNGSQHSGLYIHGGDTNDGTETLFNTYGNGGSGVEDDSTSSTSHRNTGTQGNGRDAGIAAKATSNISSISCNTSTFVCSVTAASAVASIQNGMWIVIAGTSSHNGVFYVNSYSSTTQFGFTWVGAPSGTESTGTVGVDGSTHMFANAIRSVGDASCANGQASLTSQSAQFGKDTQPGANIWIAGAGSSGALLATTISAVINEYTVTLATNCLTSVTVAQVSFGGGISHTPIMANGNSTWIAPYWEANQPAAMMSGSQVIIGGNLSINTSYGTPVQYGSLAGTANIEANGLEVENYANESTDIQIQCGLNLNQDCGFKILNYNQTANWSIYAGGSSNDQALWIRDFTSGGVIPFQTTHGGTTGLVAATNIFLTPGSGYQVQTSGQIESSLATGTAPFAVTSTTPVNNLTVSNHPEVYEAGVLTTAEKIYTNTQALSGGAATHTFANSFSYTSSSTFQCQCTDQTGTNACKAAPASSTTVTLAGTGTDTLVLFCSGH